MRAALVAAVLLVVAGIVLHALAPRFEATPRPGQIELVSGPIYRFKIKQPAFPFVLATRGKGAGTRLALSEQGEALAPIAARGDPERLLDDRGERARGHFVARGVWVYFVPSRLDDPRRRPADFRVEAQTVAGPRLFTVLLALIAVVLAYGIREWWRTVTEVPAWLIAGRDRCRAPVSRVVSRLSLGGLAALGLATALYGATCLYGLALGHAQPTAAITFLIDPRGWLQAIERYLPYGIVAMAIVGACASWLAHQELLRRADTRRAEIAIMRGWHRTGWLVVPALLVFGVSIAAWGGLARDLDNHYSAFLGHVPYADASGYYFSSLHQALHGEWVQFGARRPLAQASRDLMVLLGGFRFERIVVVQAIVLGLALNFAALRIASWRGVWVGLAFVGLMILQARFFTGSTLTEPLGLTAGLLALAVLVDAIRRQSLPHALLALATLAIALSIRMGALLLLPALVVWIGVAVADRPQRWRAVAASVAVLVAVVVLGKSLSALYAPAGALTGGNFALTLCGLSVGGDWSVSSTSFTRRNWRNLPATRRGLPPGRSGKR